MGIKRIVCWVACVIAAITLIIFGDGETASVYIAASFVLLGTS